MKLLRLLPILLISAQLLATSSTVLDLNSNNDHGIWLDQLISKRLCKRWSVQLYTQQRWGSDYRLFWYQEYTFIAQYDLHPPNPEKDKHVLHDCSVGPGFSEYQLIKKNTLGVYKWVWVSRPLIDMNCTHVYKGWELDQRLRAEYRFHNSSHYINYGDVRYRLILTAPWEFTRLKISPFVFNEFFFRRNTYNKSNGAGLVGGLYQNRFRVGLSTDTLQDKYISSIWWQWRSSKRPPGSHPRYKSNYQYGLSFTLSL